MKFADSDIDNWPYSWQGLDEDIAYGKAIVRLFKPFIRSLKESALTPKSINRHINNLFALGGWLITEINHHPKERKIEPLYLLPRYIDGYDGPWIRDLTESGQRSFDATCRKFYAWLVKNRLAKA
jgi:hypothetical protein